MTRDDIILMAREVGDTYCCDYPDDWLFDDDQLERFANLVAAAERDRMCEQFNIPKELAHEKAKGNETN